MTAQVIQGDCMEVMRGMAANSVDAIVTDPPYFKVKGEEWDNQWDRPDQFLAWIGELCEQWQRILRANGSLYVFASPKMAARVECKIGERFNVLNHIVWKKHNGYGTGSHNRSCKEVLRAFFPEGERIIFAEHYGADNIAKGEAGYAAKCDELRGFVFEPLRAYLDGERNRAGISLSDIHKKWCEHRGTKGQMTGHWFGRSQWALPTRANYLWLRDALHSLNGGGEYLLKEYEELRKEYEELRKEYEELRRPFSVTADVPFTDVWTFPTVQAYKGKHPCEKPIELMKHIISASTRPGAVVLDCFAGSGATGAACQELGRDFIGIEKDPHWVNRATHRLSIKQEALL